MNKVDYCWVAQFTLLYRLVCDSQQLGPIVFTMCMWITRAYSLNHWPYSFAATTVRSRTLLMVPTYHRFVLDTHRWTLLMHLIYFPITQMEMLQHKHIFCIHRVDGLAVRFTTCGKKHQILYNTSRRTAFSSTHIYIYIPICVCQCPLNIYQDVFHWNNVRVFGADASTVPVSARSLAWGMTTTSNFYFNFKSTLFLLLCRCISQISNLLFMLRWWLTGSCCESIDSTRTRVSGREIVSTARILKFLGQNNWVFSHIVFVPLLGTYSISRAKISPLQCRTKRWACRELRNNII